MDAALINYKLGKAFQKIVEKNCNLVPDDPHYSIGVADAEEYLLQSLKVRLTELGKHDPLVSKTYKQLALLFGRLGEHHNLYHKSAEYAQKYLESRKEMDT